MVRPDSLIASPVAALGGRGAGQHGAVLAIVLVLILAGALLSAAIAASAAIETAMAGQSIDMFAAFSAAQAGVTTALRSGEWSPGLAWTDAGALGDAEWTASITLVAASVPTDLSVPEWHFEVQSRGVAGRAETTLVQGFVVTGALPGAPVLTYWREEAPAP